MSKKMCQENCQKLSASFGSKCHQCFTTQRNFKFERMTSILEAVRHYQRSIDRSVKDEARLLHCLDKLNTLPINMKCLQETRVGRTVNNLTKHVGVVGHKATALVAKWKRKVVVENTGSSDTNGRLYADDSENVEPDSQENATLNSDSRDQTVSCSTDGNTSKPSCSGMERSKDFNTQMSESHQSSSSSISRSSATPRESGSVWSKKTKNSKREDCGKTNHKKRRRESDLIDIDCTTGTSFAEALGMLDVLSTSKAKKLPTDETPTLLTKRPLELPLDISVEILSSTVTEPEARQLAFRQPKKHTTQLNDEVTTNTISRTAKTKVFSGNKPGLKCKVPTLFDMSIKILQDNVDLLEFIGGVPFDILRPVLERTTCEQLMILEDYNPYLMEDTHCLWERHCKHRFRTRTREELETWREMYFRCLDEEQAKFNSLTAIIKVSKERLTKPAYVDTHATVKSKKSNQTMSSARETAAMSHAISLSATKSKDSNQIRKRPKKSNIDPDWTPANWYKTLYKKVRDPKPPKQQIKKTIDILRYDRAKALEKKNEEWKNRHR